jgi:hypothetical protein
VRGCALLLATPVRRSVRPHLTAGGAVDTLPGVKAFRRVMLVLGVAGIIGGVARIRGKSSVSRSEGGWRELEGPDFR